jgi:hypothetical protein
MRLFARLHFFLLAFSFLFIVSCSQPATDNPFAYSFVKPLHLKREAGKPYSDYRAFYLLTEDFEPAVGSASDVEAMNEVLKFASSLCSKYKIPWTHFVDVNTLVPAFVADDQELRRACESMIADLKTMAQTSDDCELHLHGPLNSKLLEQLKAQHKLHTRPSISEADQAYRQRRSFFFQSFYRAGYRELVSSLAYGKGFLESAIYDTKQEVPAFRPGGWDHGSNSQDTLLYFHALADAGLTANSGLSTGDFGGQNWRVGNDPGHNLAAIAVGDNTLFEVSPTAGPGGYINPVLPSDLRKLASAVTSEMPVIVAVYHLGSLQRTKRALEEGTERSEPDLQAERDALEQHFRTVAELTAAKILYPITLRELLGIISEAINR